MSADSIKPRRHKRRQVALDASCRGSDGRARDIQLTDISEGGCQVRLRGGEVELHQRVAVRTSSLESLPGVVRWSRGGEAGIEFSSALHPAVVDHLAERAAPRVLAPTPSLPAKQPVASDFVDQFGRPLPALGERRRGNR